MPTLPLFLSGKRKKLLHFSLKIISNVEYLLFQKSRIFKKSGMCDTYQLHTTSAAFSHAHEKHDQETIASKVLSTFLALMLTLNIFIFCPRFYYFQFKVVVSAPHFMQTFLWHNLRTSLFTH